MISPVYGGLAASRMITIASGAGGEAAAMQIVRIVSRGERVSTIVAEGKQLTYLSGAEHGLVRLASGQRAIVSGGPGGINFTPGQITRLYGHTHPMGQGSRFIGPSPQDYSALIRLGQKSSYVIDRGEIIKFWGP